MTLCAAHAGHDSVGYSTEENPYVLHRLVVHGLCIAVTVISSAWHQWNAPQTPVYEISMDKWNLPTSYATVQYLLYVYP